MKISRILLAAALAVAFVFQTVHAADREQLTVGELTVTTGIKAAPGSSLWVSNAVVAASTNAQTFGAVTEASVVVLGASALNTVAATGSTFTVTALNPTFAATQITFSAASGPVPTNLIVATAVSLPVRINGTNYLIRATLN